MSEFKEHSKYYLEQSDKQFQSALTFGGILILFHLTDFSAKKIDIFGLNFSLKSVHIIYGCMSLVFIYFVANAFACYSHSNLLQRVPLDRLRIKKYIFLGKLKLKKGAYSIKALKRGVRIRLFVSTLLYSFVGFPTLIILSMAFICAFHDTYIMIGHFSNNSRVLKNITSIFFDANNPDAPGKSGVASFQASGLKVLKQGEFIAQPCMPINPPKHELRDKDIHNYIEKLSEEYRRCAIRHAGALSLIDIVQGTKGTKDQVEPNVDFKQYKVVNLKFK